MTTTDKYREEARKVHYELQQSLDRGVDAISRIRAEAKAEALAAMAPCIGAYESALKDKAGECAWTESPEGYWSTSCGRSWTFIEGGPIENEISYCHGCGKPVRISDESETAEQAQKAADDRAYAWRHDMMGDEPSVEIVECGGEAPPVVVFLDKLADEPTEKGE